MFINKVRNFQVISEFSFKKVCKLFFQSELANAFPILSVNTNKVIVLFIFNGMQYLQQTIDVAIIPITLYRSENSEIAR